MQFAVMRVHLWDKYRRSCDLWGSENNANLLKLPTTKFMWKIFGGQVCLTYLCAKIYIVF